MYVLRQVLSLRTHSRLQAHKLTRSFAHAFFLCINHCFLFNFACARERVYVCVCCSCCTNSRKSPKALELFSTALPHFCYVNQHSHTYICTTHKHTHRKLQTQLRMCVHCDSSSTVRDTDLLQLARNCMPSV